MTRLLASTLVAFLTAATTPLASADETVTDRWLGTWVGTWSDRSTHTELRIDAIDGAGRVTGAYCHLDIDRPWSITDFALHTAADPKLADNAVRWEEPSRKGALRRWEFTFVDSDTLRMRHTNQHNRTHILHLKKGPSRCLDRWVFQLDQ